MLKVDLYWDLRATDPVRHTGVGKHVIEVIKGLRANDRLDVRVLLAKDQVALWRAQAPVHDWSALPTVSLPFTNKAYRFSFGAGLPLSLDQICAGRDLVYSPMELILRLKRIPFVNTIHGIPCFEDTLPQDVVKSSLYRKERIKQAWFFRRCRKLCAKSFVVSNYLKQRLTEQFGFNAPQLDVVYNGAEALFYAKPSNVIRERSIETPIRLLQIGGANVFDGAPAVLAVAQYLEQAYPDAKISIVGDRHEAPWEGRLKAQKNVEWCGFLSGTDLLGEMERSTALLYVPAVESFGIIGVEAMAAGLPILATQSTALPEVLGDAVCWIDPADEHSLQQGIELTCQNPGHRKQLIEAGYQQARRFTWPKVVDRVVASFEKIVAA